MAKKEKRPRGRPSQFTPEVLKVLFESISEGVSEFDAIKALGIGWSTWCEYKLNQYEKGSELTDFPDKYTRAKENGFISWENKLLAIANDESRDLQPDGKGGFKSDNTAVNRDRLKVDSLKWIMAKRLPKVYGEAQKIDHTTNGAPITPIFNVTIAAQDTKKN